jgi:hopanoid biosynthesis associated RND transporter like protein HpnN
MLTYLIQTIVDFSSRRAWSVIAVAVALTVASGFYAARHFAINTDVNTLISKDLPWRQRQFAMDKAFPGHENAILVVLDAPTPEMADAASAALTDRLTTLKTVLRSVRQMDRSEFFRQNGLLFQPLPKVQRATEGLSQAKPLVSMLAHDPSLRGTTKALSMALVGIQRGQLTLDDMTRPLTVAAKPIEQALAGQPAWFSWQELLGGAPAKPTELLRFIEVEPVLDFTALEPGKAATDAIRQAAIDLHLPQQFGARVRLTGPVPIGDEEFSTLREGAAVNGIATVAIVLVILWLALRSPRIILAVFLNLIAGLAVTAALGLLMVPALNLISVAFAVLFVGLGVDFGIQYSVRYRTERHKHTDLHTALKLAGRHVGAPLTLAAVATAAGFLSFLPTAYRGVSELGQIAGVGMIIALVTSITVLPALLSVLNPPGEADALGYKMLAPVDRFIERYRLPIVVGTLLLALAGSPLLLSLHFDFNPLNLRNAKTESVATFLQLRSDPALGAAAISVVSPSMPEAKRMAQKLAQLPEVAEARTLGSFVPPDQDQKLDLVNRAEAALTPTLQAQPMAAPSDADNVAALNRTADSLQKAAAAAPDKDGPGATAARRLAGDLSRLATAEPAKREDVQRAFVAPLQVALTNLRNLLQAEPVTLETLPDSLIREWVAPDGQARIELLPKGDPNDNEAMRQFAAAVQTVAPDALGGPIAILESGDTIVHAFIEAGVLAIAVIALLLIVVLRRIGDVLLTLVPLLLAGVVTLEICVLIGLPLNFANIIALPLLLGVGVAFKIYYTMAWRAGQRNLLQSPLTRAVIWSALTTATAFGSLWMSSHPGLSSMGKLLALALVTTLAAAVLFQPALMGRPRGAK